MASEKKRLLASVIASNASLLVAMIYSLSSSRLALMYVGREGFGLIGLIAQIISYLAILDLGMSLAFNRILIDYDQRDRDRFRSALQTARKVFHSLGLVGALSAVILGCFGGGFLNVPAPLNDAFRNILIAQGFAIYLSFLSKPITAPLVARGRQELVGWISAGSMVVNTVVMSLSFVLNVGIYSVLLGVLASGIFYFAFAKLLARRHLQISCRGAVFDRDIFQEVRSFARDTIFWQIGRSCMYLLPTLLMSAAYGIILVADLSGGMKMVLLLVSVCTRLPDMAVAPLSIQAAGGNPEKAVQNVVKVSEVSGAVGVLGGIFIACSNPSFVGWWMLGELHWPIGWNLAASFWLVLVILARCFSGYAVVTKQLDLIRFIPVWQSLTFVLLFSLLYQFTGPFAVVLSLPISEILISTLLVYRIHKKTALNAGAVLPMISRQFAVCAIALLAGAFGASVLEGLPWSVFHQFVISILVSGALSVVALPFLLRKHTRREILQTLGTKFRARPV